MGLLDGKNALIFGVANKNSIAWGIAQALHREGANIGLSYFGEKMERRVRPLGESINSTFIEDCDATKDDDLDALFAKAADHYGTLHILVHSIAFSPVEGLGGRFSEMSRDDFRITMDASTYSLIAMAQRAKPLMTEGGCILSMTFYAAEKVMPRYNSMAIAKAGLELSTRYLAADLGPEGIRVNAISAGAINTLAARGIQGFTDLLKGSEMVSPLRRNVTQEEVGDAAVFLASDMGKAVTGEILHVDAGYNVLGFTDFRDDAQEET